MELQTSLLLSGKCCCATGHRILVNPQIIWENLDAIMTALIKEEKYDVFLSGMAIGFDTLFARKVLEFKVKYPHIKLVCVLPCRDQSKLWRQGQVEEYIDVLSKADETICLSEEYVAGCMTRRNRYLVDHSSAVVAYYVRESKGTKSTVNYAVKKNRIIHFVQDV